jgi:hypothetical protein
MEKAERKRPEKKTKPKLTDKEPSERFIETARKIGVKESAPIFDDVLRKMGGEKDQR